MSQTRQERRRAERAAKKNEEQFQLHFEMLQPWSTFVMKTQLPPKILEKMIRITDKIVDNAENERSHGEYLAGQIEHELWVEHEILRKEEVMDFFLDVARNYVIQAQCQNEPFNRPAILAEEWYTQMLSMWIISQKDNEYNPTHIHTQCDLSSVMYLKIPEYLPNRKFNRQNDDGAITFSGSAGKCHRWGSPTMTIQPAVGDFFLFPASQQHWVYPFRTPDRKGERRSVSFNVVFSSKTEQEEYKRQQEEQQNDKL